jgi:hypothetical protein
MEHIQVSIKSDKNYGYLYQGLCTFVIISRSVLLRMKNVLDNSCRDKQNTHFVCNNFFPPENRIVYEKMWKSVVQPGRSQMKIRHMRIVCRITKAIDIHSEYVTLIAFPRQQWLRERVSMLRTYVFCLVHHRISSTAPKLSSVLGCCHGLVRQVLGTCYNMQVILSTMKVGDSG